MMRDLFCFLSNTMNDLANRSNEQQSERHHYRFHLPHVHLSSVFGDDWFALEAEPFARFFGTPTFLIAQTVVVPELVALLEQNTALTTLTKQLSERIEALTVELHAKLSPVAKSDHQAVRYRPNRSR